EAWARIDGAPRRAAVSSFGYSGTNAHLVIEEYVDTTPAATDPSVLDQVFVLSARTPEQLRQRAADLLAAIDAGRLDETRVAAVAYTLQVGREAMRHRLAIKTSSLSRLADRLRQVVDGDSRIDDCHVGEARQGKGMLDAFTADEDTHELIGKWLRRGKHHKLLDLWVKGLAIDWRRLHARAPSRVALPTYPFARDRHWVAKAAASVDAPRVPFLHPRIQRNTSMLDEQRFSSDFTGVEAGFVDRGRGRECHGVTLLDMARVAVELAAGWALGEEAIVLHDVDWNEPALGLDGALRLHVALSGSSDGPVRYDVYGDDATAPRRLHVTGMASRSSERPSSMDVATPDDADSERLLVPWHIEADTPEPPMLVDTDAFVRLLDAVRSWLGLAEGTVLRIEHLDRATIHALPRGAGHAIVERSAGDEGTTLDLCLCDDGGEVMVAFEGLRLGRDVHARPADTETASEPMILQERWERSPVAQTNAAPSGTVCFVVGEAMVEPIARALHDVAPGIVPVWLVINGGAGQAHAARRGDMAAHATAMASIAAAHGTLDALVYAASLQAPATGADWADVLCIVRNLASTNEVRCRRLVLCTAYDDALSRAHAESWIGLERSLHVLAPGFATSVVIQEGPARRAEAVAEWTRRIVGELAAPFARSVLHAQGERFVSQVREPRLDSRPGVLRNGGVYWVTGGAGGLGGIVTRHLMNRYDAKVVVSGRRVLDDALRRELSGWETRAGEWLYVTADAADEAAMRACVAQAVERFGPIEGVVHAAGTLEHTSVLDKSADAFARVLAPKVAGALALDAALVKQAPRFICYFSSTSAVLGDFGAGDYAVANRFQMAYADHVAGNGATRRIAIDWPAWADGGMRLGDEQATKLYLRSTGQHALDGATGLDVFERVLGQPSGHYLVMVGDRPRIARYLGLSGDAEAPAAVIAPMSTPPSTRTAGTATAPGNQSVEQRLRRDLRQQVCELLKLAEAEVSPSENLADYGFDSILLARWASRISERYAIALTPAVFFSHPTLGQVGDHLLTSHAAAIRAAYDDTAVSPRGATPAAAPRRRPIVQTRDEAMASATVPESIAIIGMSGRFPAARDVASFWETLVEGRDAVTEIPRERFDWTAYVGEDAPAGRRMSGRWMGACPGIGEFDAAFFDISPREALGMDPRQRLLMQEAWNALEDAAVGASHATAQKIGVFVGAEQGEYQHMVGEHGTLTSNHDAILASRLSYFLDLRGPAMTINTSCSSGLVAAHQACQSLRAGDCD
ncbi:SDR family NAD(P)-dependent oxidoreductase, partial [Luteibacter sp. CQ10]|uniref:type I polyketide synthase n=1 Tax=Luteibacter sp. CQ10 TaxID=2805821 RepID=UPI0034A46CD8